MKPCAMFAAVLAGALLAAAAEAQPARSDTTAQTSPDPRQRAIDPTSAGEIREEPLNVGPSAGQPAVPAQRQRVIGGPEMAQGNPFLASLRVVRSGPGQVNSSIPPDNCLGSTCIVRGSPGQSVVLTAQPAPGHAFQGWSGACQGSNSPTCTVYLGQVQEVTAVFAPGSTPLTITVNGGGEVTGGFGAPCNGGPCHYTIPQGQVLQLTPFPAAGHVFAGWSGACTGAGPCTVSMIQARQVTATFAPQSAASISVTITGTGDVVGGQGPCASPGCTLANTGSGSVTLNAVPSSGQVFTGWSGACSGTEPCQLARGQDHDLTAAFASGNSRTVSLTAAGPRSLSG